MTKPSKPTEIDDNDLDAVQGAGELEQVSFTYQKIQFESVKPKLTQTDNVRVPGVRKSGIRAGARLTKK